MRKKKTKEMDKVFPVEVAQLKNLKNEIQTKMKKDLKIGNERVSKTLSQSLGTTNNGLLMSISWIDDMLCIGYPKDA